MTLESLVIGLH